MTTIAEILDHFAKFWHAVGFIKIHVRKSEIHKFSQIKLANVFITTRALTIDPLF